ncbi:uncharacterized protein LOC117326850 isoform X3 [Pecten maximus]|uniref:uncharacterized protein LOC117326850 isoform X3 n=1 Tax=Pecten maximus TaxID=6579 RepID=UPI00145803DF|nr:uncharacterized protein LOC117326850 isoform X3 [Pecten maximus]XP_033739522.1 uncharacterized protein LOC117326850 isoform X3 [Pecten maximus]
MLTKMVDQVLQAEVSGSPAFFGQSLKDPKKSAELLRILNKIRELQNCPVDIPPGYAQRATAAEVVNDDDLETDVVLGSSREPEPALFGEELFKSKSSKQLTLPGSQGKNNTNIGNVRYLLATPAASSVLEMDYGYDAVVQAISTYMKHKGNVEFDVNDLITILEDEEPKIQKIEATNT